MKKETLSVMVIKNFDADNIEGTMIPENIEMFVLDAKNLIVATCDGEKIDDTLAINALVHGDNYEALSRMFMLLSSKVYATFIESKEKKGE